MSWKDVWEKKGKIDKKEFTLADLICADGYDGAGAIEVDAWCEMVFTIERKLGLEPSMSICEIGCGAGAFLYPLYQKGYRALSGIDYSPGLVAICSTVMPEGDFRVAEARKIPFDAESFDSVICVGVFHYFPDLDYAEDTIKEILRIEKSNAPARSAIVDICDAATKREYEDARRSKVGEAQYDKLYKNYPHFFYKREWFAYLGKKYHLDFDIETNSVRGYVNSKYRFNFYFRKK